MDIHVYLHDASEGTTHQILREVLAGLRHLTKQGDRIMSTMQDVQNDLEQIKQGVGDYIAQRDAIDVDLKAQLAAALANAGVSPEEQAAIDKAFTTAEEAKALLAPPVPVEPPADTPPV
jgi:hypothetical protein